MLGKSIWRIVMKRATGLGILCSVLAATSVQAAHQAGVNIGLPLSFKGEQRSGFIIGGLISTPMMNKVTLDTGVDFISAQFSQGTQSYIGYSAVGRYSVYCAAETLAVDALIGLEGNGYSGLGLAIGAVGRYSLSNGTDARVRLTYNTNQDMLFNVQLVKEIKMPDFGGGKKSAPVAAVEVVPANSAPAASSIPAEPTQMLAVEETVESAPVKPVAPKVETELSYKDIAGHWAKPDIEWAASNGIFAQADKFAPNVAVNRYAAESIVKKVAVYLGVPNAAISTAFGPSVTKKDFVAGMLRTVAVAKGTENPTDADLAKLAKKYKLAESLTSDKQITRAEAAVVVSKLLQAVPK